MYIRDANIISANFKGDKISKGYEDNGEIFPEEYLPVKTCFFIIGSVLLLNIHFQLTKHKQLL